MDRLALLIGRLLLGHVLANITTVARSAVFESAVLSILVATSVRYRHAISSLMIAGAVRVCSRHLYQVLEQ